MRRWYPRCLTPWQLIATQWIHIVVGVLALQASPLQNLHCAFREWLKVWGFFCTHSWWSWGDNSSYSMDHLHLGYTIRPHFPNSILWWYFYSFCIRMRLRPWWLYKCQEFSLNNFHDGIGEENTQVKFPLLLCKTPPIAEEDEEGLTGASTFHFN